VLRTLPSTRATCWAGCAPDPDRHLERTTGQYGLPRPAWWSSTRRAYYYHFPPADQASATNQTLTATGRA